MTGQPQIVLRSLQAEFEEVVTEDIVGLLVKPLATRKVADQVAAHPDIPGNLAPETRT